MLVPQTEVNVAEWGGRLPLKYQGEMLFSRIGPDQSWSGDDDPEVSSDPSLEALWDKYMAELR